MYFMIDNYDSFVYNLHAYMLENGQDVLVRRADEVSMKEIADLHPEGIIISPGPKRPEDAEMSMRILETWQGIVPILGVCLGHQLIGHYYGAQVSHGASPVHGKISSITHSGTGVFQDLPKLFRVTRYHSLVVKEEQLPDSLRITARTGDGIIMGLEHTSLPVYGVQFHPEAVLTEYGHELLQNFHQICQKWQASDKKAVIPCAV